MECQEKLTFIIVFKMVADKDRGRFLNCKSYAFWALASNPLDRLGFWLELLVRYIISKHFVFQVVCCVSHHVLYQLWIKQFEKSGITWMLQKVCIRNFSQPIPFCENRYLFQLETPRTYFYAIFLSVVFS